VVEQQLHPVGKHRSERLHALDRDPVGDLAEQLGEAGMGVGEFLGPGPDAGSEEQLAAGRRPQAAGRAAGAALVGDLEDADLLDRVAEELDPQRMLLGRREHVEQSAADRQLAALGHHLRTRVSDVDQPRDHVVLVGLVSFAQPDRLQVGEPGDDRLQDAPHRRDDDLERAWLSIGGATRPPEPPLADRMSQAAQHRDPLAHRVRTRRQPLVRQRLPAGEAGDGIGRQECAKRGRQVLGLPRGRGHGEYEPAGAVPAGSGVRAADAGRERRDDQRPQRWRRDEVTLAAGQVGWAGEGGRELGIFGNGGE